jgi:two-component system, LytTR family, response regulator LytT
MKVLIAEDEWLAAQRLQLLLREAAPDAEVVCVAESIDEAVRYLQQNEHPDLLLLDIHLSDGHSFEIFRRCEVKIPVIFTTAFDQYAIEAFKVFSIDYILKPITADALTQAMRKFHQVASLKKNTDYEALLQKISNLKETRHKSRFLAKVGQKLFFVETEEVAYFQADNKVVYLVDKEGNRYIIDYTLDKLESLLDPSVFFRLNRRFMVRYSAIQHIKPFSNSRLKLSVKGVAAQEEIIISRERVSEFKLWAEA